MKPPPQPFATALNGASDADITKARAILGYDPHTKIAEGIPKFVEWFLKTRP